MSRGLEYRQSLDPSDKVHLHARFVALAGGENNTVLASVGLQDRPDGRVDLRIHQHDILAVLERFEGDVSTELDGARGVD